MAFRGRGRGRGGFGGGGFRPAKQVPFELFPEIEDLEPAKFNGSKEIEQLVRWSLSLQKYCQNSSPYFYEDKNQRLEQVQIPDIERYSNRNSRSKISRPPLSDFIKLEPDHMPAELARGGNREKRVAKKVRWNPGSDKLDLFEKLEQKSQGQKGTEKKENEEEEEQEEEANEEDEGEFSDEGDYEQAEYFDDDEDDFNMADDNDDEPIF